MALPIQQTKDQDFALMQQRWASQLNPLLANLLVQGNILNDIVLVNGAKTFNHYLGRQMVGYFVVDQTASASIFRSAPLNSQTLTLTSSAAVTVNLWVF